MHKLSGLLLGSAALGLGALAWHFAGSEHQPPPARPQSSTTSSPELPASADAAQHPAGMALSRHPESRTEIRPIADPAKPLSSTVGGLPAVVHVDAAVAQPSPALADASPKPATQSRAFVRAAGTPRFSEQAGFELDPGVQAPVAMSPTNPALGFSPQQEALKNQIMNQFLQELDAVAASSAGQDAIANAWASGQKRADERFRVLFGEAAYQKQGVKIARESVGLSE